MKFKGDLLHRALTEEFSSTMKDRMEDGLNNVTAIEAASFAEIQLLHRYPEFVKEINRVYENVMTLLYNGAEKERSLLADK